MAEQVVIEFVGDVGGLQPVVSAMKLLGTLTAEQEAAFNDMAKAQQESFAKAREAAQKAAQGVDGLGEALKGVSGNVQIEALKKALAELQQRFDDLAKKNIPETGAQTERLTTKLRNLQNQLTGLEPGTKEFTKLGVEAAKIRDKIEASHKAVRILASDTRALDTFVATAQGIAGAFAVAQGAAALLGEENEDLQKALLKVQASLAILNGLQAVSETLNKKNVIAVNLNAAAQAAYTTVVGTSTGAMKAFRIALASTGIGLVVIALAALVTNFDKIKSKVTELFPVLNRFGEIWDGIKKNFFGFISGFTEGLSIAKDLLVDFFTSDFSGIAVTASEAGKRLSAAFNKGYIEEEQSQQEERQRVLTQGLIEENKRRLNILEASGKDTFALRKKILEDELSLLKEHSERLNKQNEIDVLIAARRKEQLQKQLSELQTDLLKTAETKPIEVPTILRTPEADDIANKVKQIQDLVDGKSVILDLKLEVKEDLPGVDTSSLDKDISDRKEREDIIRETTIAAAQETSDAIFQIGAERRAAELNADLAALNAERDAKLSNANITEKKREQINKEYARKEADIKRKAWNDDKNAKLAQATINGALAITNVLANMTDPTPAQAFKYAAIALNAITLAAQIAVISSQKPPQFAKGTKSAPGGWAVVGEEGEELVHLPQGAKVITHPETKQLLEGKNLDSIISKYNLPSIKREFPEVRKVAMGNSRQAAFMGFDYKKLGEEIAKHPRTLININERGLETRIISENNERILFNQQYSSP